MSSVLEIRRRKNPALRYYLVLVFHVSGKPTNPVSPAHPVFGSAEAEFGYRSALTTNELSFSFPLKILTDTQLVY